MVGGAREVDVDDLVVTVAAAGQVVAEVLDRAFRRTQVVEEHEVIIGQHLLVRAERDGAGVEVEVGAGGGPDVPAEADRDRGEAGGLLVSDISALAQAPRPLCIAFR